MREQVIDEVVARRFLLGELPPEEQWRIEELAFQDSDTFTFLESAEDDLIDDFIQGELSPDEKQRFENHFLPLVPGRREYVETSRLMQLGIDKALRKEQDPAKPFSFIKWFNRQHLWLQLPMTVAPLALILITVLPYLRPDDRPPAPIQAGPDKPVVIPSPELNVSPSPAPTQSPVHAENKPKPPSGRETPRGGGLYATLMPGSFRSEAPQPLQWPSDSPDLKIQLPLVAGAGHKTYEAVLETEDGTVLQRWSQLKAQRARPFRVLRIEVPLSLLRSEQFYQIVVSSVSSKGPAQEIDRYPFEVIN